MVSAARWHATQVRNASLPKGPRAKGLRVKPPCLSACLSSNQSIDKSLVCMYDSPDGGCSYRIFLDARPNADSMISYIYSRDFSPPGEEFVSIMAGRAVRCTYCMYGGRSGERLQKSRLSSGRGPIMGHPATRPSPLALSSMMPVKCPVVPLAVRGYTSVERGCPLG
jgi:DNA-directed RNA polymerase subunit RPC12/RpoP